MPPSHAGSVRASGDKRQLRRVYGYLAPYRWRIALGVALLVLATPATLFLPLVWKFIVDEVITR
jgi:ABC-type multidrug transport system fused ATPase/permease subunit